MCDLLQTDSWDVTAILGAVCGVSAHVWGSSADADMPQESLPGLADLAKTHGMSDHVLDIHYDGAVGVLLNYNLPSFFFLF